LQPQRQPRLTAFWTNIALPTGGQINELMALHPKQTCYLDRNKRHKRSVYQKWNWGLAEEPHDQVQ
jgi:hypothetical protein